MTPQDPNTDPRLEDPLLEQAIAEIRDEPIDPAVMEAAARRVGARLEQHTALRGCADFQALIPEYRAGTLSGERALLLKDHTNECVACRKALEAASGKVTAMPVRHARRPWSAMPGFRWAVAAALMVAAGLAFWAVGDRFRPPPSGPGAVGRRGRHAHGAGFGRDAAAARPIAGRNARALGLFRLRAWQGHDHRPGAWRHHRTGRQAPFRSSVRGDARLPRGRHRHRLQRKQRTKRVACYGDRGHGIGGPGQPR